jgi:NADH-quinone oxidoreductase subunit J
MELALFALLALVAIVSAAAMIYSRNSIHSALFLILNFGCVALLFLMLDAPFISMVQIAVYAGAIMVLFLFVIMLLGAEQTTDTEARRLGWLPATSTILAAVLLGALGLGMLATGSLDLPESPGEAPRLRIVNLTNNEFLTVFIDGEPLEDLYFGEDTGFLTLEAGNHDILLRNEAEIETALINGLELNETTTMVLYGDASVHHIDVPNSFAPTADDEGRLMVLNLFTEELITLIDWGTDRILSLNEQTGALLDRIVHVEFPFGQVVTFPPYREGDYSYAFYTQLPNGDYDELVALNNPETGNWPVKSGTEQLIIIAPNYNSLSHEAMVVDSLQESLVIETNETFGSPRDIGRDLFTTYLLPVNVVGFLLLVALVGVIVLTRPEVLAAPRRSSINRRRKVSRPLVNVISQQTGQDVVVETPKLDDPSSGD